MGGNLEEKTASREMKENVESVKTNRAGKGCPPCYTLLSVYFAVPLRVMDVVGERGSFE